MGKKASDKKAGSADLVDWQGRCRRLEALLSGMAFEVAKEEDGRFVFTSVNGGAKPLLGFEPEAILAESEQLLGSFNPQDRAAFEAALSASELTQEPVRCEVRLERDGSLRWLAIHAQPLGGRGRKAAWDGIILDITEQKRLEEEVQQSRSRCLQLQSAIRRMEEDRRKFFQLNEMRDLLQLCHDLDDAYQTIALSLQGLFPELAGFLATRDGEDGRLVGNASWGGMPPPESIEISHCQALRDVQPRQVEAACSHRHCPHTIESSPASRLCQPLVAQGQQIGLLHLARLDSHEALPAATVELAEIAAETIELALMNIKLRNSLNEQAIRDPLTGLYNRRYLEEALLHEIGQAIRYQRAVGVMMLDLDHFKRINDSFGHEVGDRFLRDFGSYLQANTRQGDTVCRYGGEEFVVVLHNSGRNSTWRRAEHLREEFKRLRFCYDGTEVGRHTVSIGIAQGPDDGTSPELLLRLADQALYRAKAKGRDRVELVRDDTLEDPPSVEC